MDIFSTVPNWIDLNEPDFNKSGKVHDWRNHVDLGFIEIWNDLSLREKQIIYIIAEQAASAEEWE